MRRQLYLLLLCAISGLGMGAQSARAQIISNQPTTVVDSSNPFGHIILGGAQQGQNLFHSFSQLDTSNGRFINFIAPPSVTNVISRITDAPTHINGVVAITSDGVNLSPNTNLFLLSPNGITLGSNTLTNIDGAFVSSTATGLSFSDGTLFEADTDATPLLSVSAPIGLQMGNNPAPIQVQGINSTSPAFGFNSLSRGQNTVLVGGDIEINGGTVNLVGGRLQLAGLSEGGSVSLDSSLGVLNAVLPFGVARADVKIGNGAAITTSAPIEATRISARNLQLTETSNLLSGALPGVPLPYKVGAINIDVTGDVTLVGSNIYNASDFGAIGDTGDINLRASSLSLSEAAQIGAIGRGNGDIGNLNIVVDKKIVLDGTNSFLERRTGLYSIVGDLFVPQGSGQAGNLNVRTNSLALVSGALITASTLGIGNAGNVSIVAEEVLVDGVSDIDGLSSSISSSVEFSATGDGGSVDVNADRLTIDRGGAIFGRTQGKGNAGSIELSVGELSVLNGGQIVTTSFTDGNAGDISVVVRDRAVLAGIDPTYGRRIAASDFNLLGGEASGIYANTTDTSSGVGGSITVNTPQLLLSDAGQISVSSLGIGAAGGLSIDATEQLRLDRGTVQAESRGGSEGNIAIAAPLLQLRDNSTITTNATGAAIGGSIDLKSQFIIGTNNSDIVARATQGAGGQINIESTGLIGIAPRPELTSRSDINASSKLGVDGTIAVTSPDVAPDSGLTALPASLVDASEQLTAGCSASQSQFVATGRGGLPVNPNGSIASNRPWQDIRAAASTPAVSFTAQLSTAASSILIEEVDQVHHEEAITWQRNNNNEVVLLAGSGIPSPKQKTACLSQS